MAKRKRKPRVTINGVEIDASKVTFHEQPLEQVFGSEAEIELQVVWIPVFGARNTIALLRALTDPDQARQN